MQCCNGAAAQLVDFIEPQRTLTDPRRESGPEIDGERGQQGSSLNSRNCDSGSAAAAIKLRKEGSGLIVQIRDHGKGILEEKQQELMTSGLGFGGMRERLKAAGGTLEIQSDGTGTTVSAILKAA